MNFSGQMYFWRLISGDMVVSTIIFGQSSSGLTKTLQLMLWDGSILAKLGININNNYVQLEYDYVNVGVGFLCAIVISATLFTTTLTNGPLLPHFGAPTPGSS